jgi:hypothetical protein
MWKLELVEKCNSNGTPLMCDQTPLLILSLEFFVDGNFFESEEVLVLTL